jgi:hypothetical protein
VCFLEDITGERRLGELRCLAKARRRVLLVVEDLKWTAEFWAGHIQSSRRGYYSSIEHVVTELRAMAFCGEHSADGGVCWLLR